MKRRIKKVAVLGSGVMGSRIACHFANVGLEVLLLDIVPRELNEKEKATATLTYLKYKKMRDEMQKLKMHGGPDDYLENLEKIKKEAGIDNLYKSYEDKKSLDRIKKHPEEVIKLK